MAITYQEEFVTRKASVDVSGEYNYRLQYVTNEDMEGNVNEIIMSVYKVTVNDSEESLTRAGNASYTKGNRNYLSFEQGLLTSVADQAIIANQYFNDLQEILA